MRATGSRLNHRLERALSGGKIVLCDRYIGSNLAHQVARTPVEHRSEMMRWIEHLEYTIYGMPRENLILYLRVPPAEAQKLVARKAPRTYTKATHDIQENNLRHLEDAAEMYDMLSRSRPWATIQCFDAQRGSIRLPEEISAETAGSGAEPGDAEGCALNHGIRRICGERTHY